MDGDFELDRVLMVRGVGRLVRDFAVRYGLSDLSVLVSCDAPDASFSSEGDSSHGLSVRVYLDLGGDGGELED